MAEYLPKELPKLSREEIMKIIEDVKEHGAGDFSSIMRETMKQAKGRADGKIVGEVIKEVLG